MTVKRKKKGTFMGGRAVAVAFSLCLLAVVTMIGMYTVGRTDQKKEQLEDQIAKAEQAKSTEEEIRKEEAEKEKETQAAASSSATRQKDDAKKDTTVINSAELESNFREEEVAENIEVDEMEEAASDEVTEEPTLSFTPEEDKLLWPVAGNIILDYSMDKSVYFPTLDQYKYNPAVIIEGTVDESVMCGAQGQVTSIETLEETGMTVTLDIGNGYELVYGQLKELPVQEGDYIKAGETIGYVSEPTKYYSKEGTNVYFEIRKDGKSVDPMPLLQ